MNTYCLSGKTFVLFLAASLLGTSCSLPQRAHSILPPTSEHDLCREDRRFYYSSVFQICFRYPATGWEEVTASLPATVPGTSISAITFFLPQDQTPKPLFTLFVTSVTDTDREWFQDQDVLLVSDGPNYLIGYGLTDTTAPLAADLPKMMEGLKVFAPNTR
jgi:hypothetical protein